MRNGSHRFWLCIAAAIAVTVIAVPAASADVVKYDTTLTLTKDGGANYHGFVNSDRDRNPGYDPATAVRKCMEGRRVVVFKVRPGADRTLGADRSEIERFGGHDEDPQSTYPVGVWWARVARDYGTSVRAKVERKVRDRYVCRAEHAAFSP